MKKLIVLSLVSLFVVFNSFAYSQTDMIGKFAVTPHGGLGIPMGDFGDVSKLGFGFGADFEYYVIKDVSVGASVAYNITEASDDYKSFWLLSDSTADVKSFKILQGTVFGSYHIPTQSKISPYVKAGVGIYNLKAGDIEFQDSTLTSDSETKLGINGGAGLRFGVSDKLNVFLEGTFHNVFTDVKNTKYLNVFGGVTLMFGGKGTPSAE